MLIDFSTHLDFAVWKSNNSICIIRRSLALGLHICARVPKPGFDPELTEATPYGSVDCLQITSYPQGIACIWLTKNVRHRAQMECTEAWSCPIHCSTWCQYATSSIFRQVFLFCDVIVQPGKNPSTNKLPGDILLPILVESDALWLIHQFPSCAWILGQ